MSDNLSNKYQKLTHREHILKRPDTYIGSIDNEERELWTSNLDIENPKIELKKVKYNPGYIKIYDEILVNASDHAIRTNKVTYIRITVDKDFISVENDGPGIPIQIHEKEKVYIPELIFGHLLTGENYDDTGERFVGGRNGYGAKLCAVFSKKFIVETADGKKKYIQDFENNLLKINKPKITSSSKSYTKITYYPDFSKFNITHNTEEIESLLLKRAIDIASYNRIKVFYNNKLIKFKKFEDYIKMYTDNETYVQKISSNWEIGITNTPTDKMEQVSIVNGISTNNGGTHVQYIANYISNEIKEYLQKKVKGYTIANNDIKNKFFLFIICKIPNPSFETQTKETLTTKINAEITKDFNFPQIFFNKVFKSEIVESILDWIDQKKLADENKLARDLNKNLSKLKVDKLVDAKGKDRWKCSLGIFEGDSAANGCRRYRDPELMGFFPLKGKFINVSEISNSKLTGNAEAVGLMACLGLKLGEKADRLKMRYGKIILYTDQDCLEENTLIITKDGEKKIKDITYEDLILTHTGEYKKVKNIIKKDVSNYIKIIVNGNTIICSENHKLIIFRNGEVMEMEAKNIKYTDFFLIKKEA